MNMQQASVETTPVWPDVTVFASTDENVRKYVFSKPAAAAETVLYKYHDYTRRTVICCSTQS